MSDDERRALLKVAEDLDQSASAIRSIVGPVPVIPQLIPLPGKRPGWRKKTDEDQAA